MHSLKLGMSKLAQAQLLREPVIDPSTAQHTRFVPVSDSSLLNPEELIEMDFGRLLAGPYSLRVTDILDYLERIAGQLQDNWSTVERVHQLCANTSQQPRPYLDGAFAALLVGLDGEAARNTINNELAAWGLPGSQFLDGWVEVPGQVIPGLVPILAQALPGSALAAGPGTVRTLIRAMPTRQLHITAGNAPQVPLISALRLILTKSAGAVKFPFEATLPGALLGLASLRGGSRPSHDSESFRQSTGMVEMKAWRIF